MERSAQDRQGFDRRARRAHDSSQVLLLIPSGLVLEDLAGLHRTVELHLLLH